MIINGSGTSIINSDVIDYRNHRQECFSVGESQELNTKRKQILFVVDSLLKKEVCENNRKKIINLRKDISQKTTFNELCDVGLPNIWFNTNWAIFVVEIETEILNNYLCKN